MTTILYHQGRIYADSTIVKGTERLDSLTKIQRIETPFQIKSEREDFVFDDKVYGYSGTGSQPGMAGIVENFAVSSKTHGNSDATISFYNIAAQSGMVGYGTTFEVMLVGEKALHNFRFDTEGFKYIRYEKENIVTMGSGSTDCLAHIQYHDDPVRAMLETFATEVNSGGFIDCWQLSEKEGEFEGVPTKTYRFERVGIFEPIPKDLIRYVLQKVWPDPMNDPIPLTFVRSSAWMKSNSELINRIGQLEKEVTRLKNQNLRLKGKPVPKKTPAKKVVSK